MTVIVNSQENLVHKSTGEIWKTYETENVYRQTPKKNVKFIKKNGKNGLIRNQQVWHFEKNAIISPAQ